MFVEGNADLTPAKLVGHHNPARVLREDYSADNFVDGPLLEAMRDGGFLYIEEFNRAPEDTLNTLLTAMAERQIAVPTAGTVTAAPTFRVVASMNPYDNVGTTRLSTTVHDRLCRLAIGYQDAAAERGIVALRAPLPSLAPDLYARLVADAVAVTRATREHPDIRQGSSVRGAIDLDPGGRRSCSDAARDLAGASDEGLPRAGVRRHGRRAVRPDPPRRDGRRDPGGGAARRSGRTTSSSAPAAAAPVEGQSRPTRRCGGARTGARDRAAAAAAQAQAARRGTDAARSRVRRRQGSCCPAAGAAGAAGRRAAGQRRARP